MNAGIFICSEAVLQCDIRTFAEVKDLNTFYTPGRLRGVTGRWGPCVSHGALRNLRIVCIGPTGSENCALHHIYKFRE